MEKLKPFEDFGKPDPRIEAFQTFDKECLVYMPFTANDLHNTASGIQLHTGVPKCIRSHFAIAQNLFVYSWFYYPFIAKAGFLALITTEKALKNRLGFQNSRKSFFELIVMATKKGFLCETGYTILELDSEIQVELEKITGHKHQRKETDFIQRLPKMLTAIRNSVAHGETNIHPLGAMIMQIAAETINQLYDEEV